MTQTFISHAENPETGESVDVEVHYRFTPPLAATYDLPCEGGCEILDIVAPFHLSRQQLLRVEQECATFAWRNHRG